MPIAISQLGDKMLDQIFANPSVQAALAHLRADPGRIIAKAIAIQQIAAPTFAEAERARYVESQFRALGLEDVNRDSLDNVYGLIAGRNQAPPLIVTAHTDTVFPAGTNLAIRQEGQRVYGPGIADNSLGVAGLLALAQLLGDFGLAPAGDIWLVANVGEEGLGDLRGMRAVVAHFGPANYVVVEGGMYGRLCHQAIGVRRYRLTVQTPGGHSWAAFGTPSAIHHLGRLIAAIDGLSVPNAPKTTYNVGLIEGGTSVNSIAHSASLLLDLRSEQPAALEQLVAEVEKIVHQSQQPPLIRIEQDVIGNRPAGQIPRQSPIVSLATEALNLVGCQTIEYVAASTDANIPLSLGYPAVCLGLTRSGHSHRPDEYLESQFVPAGMGQLLLLTLALTT